MNEKEIGEIRRRTRRDRSNMTAIYGCYVNANKEIISSFRQSVGMMPENEAENILAFLSAPFPEVWERTSLMSLSEPARWRTVRNTNF